VLKVRKWKSGRPAAARPFAMRPRAMHLPDTVRPRGHGYEPNRGRESLISFHH
jgi:hypothetical protein